MDKEVKPLNIRAEISEDYYSASLTLEYINGIHPKEDYDKVMDVLKRHNIVYGVDYAAIIEALASESLYKHLVVAKGDPHRSGQNAYVTQEVNFEGASKPIIQEDGSVDFKNLLQVSAVKKGKILAIKTPIIEGVDGMTVTGKLVTHRPGKDKIWKIGENVAISDDGNQLIAEMDGIAKLIKDRITVSQHIEIDEVGPLTGNIYFGGDVHVKGNVLDGYTIHCDGDLTIDGVVEGAIINTKGNLIVNKGILGRGMSDIVVGGNLTAKFIENANIYAKGEIETGEIVNSKVLCDSKITVKGKKGLIIGGDITSKYLIEANQIGSKLGVITTINLGVDISAIKELKALKENLIELKIVETRLRSRIPVLKNNALVQPEVGVHEDHLKQYTDSLLSVQIDIEEKQSRSDQLMDAMKKATQGKVKINQIHPDTMVTIGDSKYFVDKTLSACIISKAGDYVVAIGLEKEQNKL